MNQFGASPLQMPEKGIRTGPGVHKTGKIRPAMEIFAEFEAEHGIAR
jgi:hypothetical protein